MAKKKASSKGRLIVTLECTEARQEGATPSRYVTQKVRLGPAGRRVAGRGGLSCGNGAGGDVAACEQAIL